MPDARNSVKSSSLPVAVKYKTMSWILKLAIVAVTTLEGFNISSVQGVLCLSRSTGLSTSTSNCPNSSMEHVQNISTAAHLAAENLFLTTDAPNYAQFKRTFGSLSINLVENNTSLETNSLFVSRAAVRKTPGKVFLSPNETSVTAESDTAPSGFVAYATKINLNHTTMETFIKENLTIWMDNMRRETFLMPGTPYISISAVNPISNGTVPLNITFTYAVPTNVLDAKVQAIISNSTQGSRILFDMQPKCSYMDFNKSQFSQLGCTSQTSRASGNVTCSCNHTTLFAVLLTATTVTVPYEVQIVSYVTSSISLVCLAITLIVLTTLRQRMKNDRVTTQISLTASYLLLYFFTLFQTVAVRNARACEMITVLVHYFLLATGGWMNAEAFSLLLKISKQSMEFTGKKRMAVRRIRYVIGWGVPGIIVTFSATVGFITGTYMDVSSAYSNMAIHPNSSIPKYSYCWLSTMSLMRILVAIVPLACSLLFNIAVAIKVVHFVTRMNKKTQNYVPQDEQRHGSSKTNIDLDQLVAGCKALGMLIPVLGITGIFAFLAGVPDQLASTTFMYLNALINGLQGFFIFLVYCLLGKNVRKTAVKEWQKYKEMSSF